MLESSQSYKDMALFLRDPIECYRQAAGLERFHSISFIEQTFEQIDEDHVRLESTMPEGYEPFYSFFLVRQGVLEMVPTLIGFPKAVVKVSMTARGAILDIRIIRPSGFLAVIRAWYRSMQGLFVPRERVVELLESLNRRHKVANSRIEDLDSKQRELKRSEELFSHAFRAAPVAMLIIRMRDRKIVDVNDQFLRSTGYSREDVTSWDSPGSKIWARSEDRDAVFSAISKPGGSVDGIEAGLRHRDGRESVALISAKKVKLAGDSCVLWQGIDISERKLVETELAQHRDHLEELVAERTHELERSVESFHRVEHLASLGTLAAGMAHQINNPIGAIRVASEFGLSCEGEADALLQYRNSLETCAQQSDRCGQIVRNILRFSRGETGERSPENLLQLIDSSCRLVWAYAAEHGAKIDIRATDSEISVFVNAIEIEQVLVNVIRNAVESGGTGCRIDVHANLDGTNAVVEIRDDGPGIDAEQLPFLFDPFYTTRLRDGGTGLGLSVAHGIVNAHGGEIRADTQRTKGASIQIRLPASVGTGA